MPTLSYAWRNPDGGPPPTVKIKLTPPAARASTVETGKTVSPSATTDASLTGAGTITDLDPGLYNTYITFGRPNSDRYTGAGRIETTIYMPDHDEELGDLLAAAQTTPPTGPTWVAVVEDMVKASTIPQSTTPPTAPSVGDLWLDTSA